MLREKGISLIEVLLSVSISSIVLLGLLKIEIHLLLFQTTLLNEAKSLMKMFNQKQLQNKGYENSARI